MNLNETSLSFSHVFTMSDSHSKILFASGRIVTAQRVQLPLFPLYPLKDLVK